MICCPRVYNHLPFRNLGKKERPITIAFKTSKKSQSVHSSKDTMVLTFSFFWSDLNDRVNIKCFDAPSGSLSWKSYAKVNKRSTFGFLHQKQNNTRDSWIAPNASQHTLRTVYIFKAETTKDKQTMMGKKIFWYKIWEGRKEGRTEMKRRYSCIKTNCVLTDSEIEM